MSTIEATGRLFDLTAHNPSFEQIRSRHRGALIDFCVPVNAYFPPQEMAESIIENLPAALKHYPDYAAVHQEHVAALTGIPAENIVVANGSTEIITLLCRDMRGPLVTCVPTFGRWVDLPADFQVPARYIHRVAERDFELDVDEVLAHVTAARAQRVVLCNPNNPTGAAFSQAEIVYLLERLRAVPLVVLDESFIDFSDIESAQRIAIESTNTVIVKSMGKSLGWHGVRLGYAVANKRLAQELRRRTPYWNINGVAALVLRHLPRYRISYRESFRRMGQDRVYVAQALATVDGLRTYPSHANFLYTRLPLGVSGKAVRDRLLEDHGLVVRECSNKIGSSERFLRLAVHPKPACDTLVGALRTTLRELTSDLQVA